MSEPRPAQLAAAQDEHFPGATLAHGFLAVPTPGAWLEAVPEYLELLLIDHANCEKKAAATCLSLLHRYDDRVELVRIASRFARQELRHFEQVLRWLERRGIPWRRLSASRYAATLWREVSGSEPQRRLDTLICAAFVEARSCERFAAIVPVLTPIDPQLAAFYQRLMASEAGHFAGYVELARRDFDADLVERRIARFRTLDAELVTAPDALFRFHSGPPA